MKAVKGTYNKGRIKLAEKPSDPGPVEVVVVFPETDDDPWEQILSEKKLRPAFAKFVDQCKKDIAAGKANPMKPCLTNGSVDRLIADAPAHGTLG